MSTDIPQLCQSLATHAREAALTLANAPAQQRAQALHALARRIA